MLMEEKIARLLTAQKKTLCVAESCSGGLLCNRLTNIPGSSHFLKFGLVLYSNDAKIRFLKISVPTLNKYGAVSEPVAEAMAIGCRRAASSDYALSITGIAGPTGGSPPEKPIGLVYIGLACETGVETLRVLCGDHLTRDEIRDRSCKTAFNLLRIRLLGIDAANRS